MITRRALPLLSLPILAAPARAQAPSASALAWPQRPPRIIVLFTPGGSPDLLARLLA